MFNSYPILMPSVNVTRESNMDTKEQTQSIRWSMSLLVLEQGAKEVVGSIDTQWPDSVLEQVGLIDTKGKD